ncbi:MAG: EscU/YscU/HrcU family type III secretion system export apparatus switch protein, partial [Planctomycetota bacterium]|nr:EscU/YscU/HrcU family type III secretion system export apparatus switch protein [Planctomycetota bacterium]
MAEEMGDKTEAPTPRRRQEAREQGNIARSPDLTAAVILIGMLMMLKNFGPGLVGGLRAFIQEMLSDVSFQDLSTGSIGTQLLRGLAIAGRALAPMFIGLVVIAIVINVLQVGLFFNTKRLQPSMRALNPLKGLSKLFGKSQTLVQLGMNFLKLALVTCVAYSAVHGRLEQIISVQGLSFSQIFGLGAELIYAIGIRIGVLLLI